MKTRAEVSRAPVKKSVDMEERLLREVQAAFRFLDHYNQLGYITIAEFDPESFWAFEDFKECVLYRYGTFQRCFELCDPNFAEMLTYAQFRGLCDECKYRGITRGVRRLFVYLDPDKAGNLLLEQIDKKAAKDHHRRAVKHRMNMGLAPEIRKQVADWAEVAEREVREQAARAVLH